MAFYGKVNGEWEKLSNFNTYKDFSLVTGDSNQEVKRIVEDGSAASWTFAGHTDFISDIALDKNLNAFTSSTDGTVRKLDPNGQELWQFEDIGTNFASVAVGPDGYVYAGDASAEIRKISPDGSTEEWTYSPPGNVNGIEVDASGYIYATGADDLEKIDPGGSKVWTFSGHDRVINGITVAPDGSIYTASFGSDGTVKKVKNNGEEAWSFGSFTSVVNDSAVNFTTGEVYGVAGEEIRKFDNKGDQKFEYTGINATIQTAAVDKNGFLYVGDNNQNVFKLEDTGSGFNEVFEFQGHNGTVQGNDVHIAT